MRKIRMLSLYILMIFSSSIYSEVYQWTDQNGRIHFSDRPHKQSKAIEIKAPKASGVGVNQDQLLRQKELSQSFQNQREKQQANKQKSRQLQEKQAAYCQRLKNRRLNYVEAGYLFIRDDQGKKKRLSSERKKQEIKKLEIEIDKHCS